MKEKIDNIKFTSTKVFIIITIVILFVVIWAIWQDKKFDKKYKEYMKIIMDKQNNK